MISLSSADYFQNQLSPKILSGIPSECQTVWIQIRPDSVGPDLGPNCLQGFSADDTGRLRVNATSFLNPYLFSIAIYGVINLSIPRQET